MNIQKLVLNFNNFQEGEEISKFDDSVYQSEKITTVIKSERPSFVDDLFRKYGYEELDPWKKAQKKTKNNNLCLFEIKSIYNKICSLFS